MTDNIKKLYKRARADEKFLSEIKNDSANNKKPGIFAHWMEEHLFAMCYYGWYIAKHGKYND